MKDVLPSTVDRYYLSMGRFTFREILLVFSVLGRLCTASQDNAQKLIIALLPEMLPKGVPRSILHCIFFYHMAPVVCSGFPICLSGIQLLPTTCRKSRHHI